MPNCGVFIFDQCVSCKPGYVRNIDLSACTQDCSLVKNCTSCDKTDSSICLGCQSGYKLVTL